MSRYPDLALGFQCHGRAVMEIRPRLPAPNQEFPPHNIAILSLSVRF